MVLGRREKQEKGLKIVIPSSSRVSSGGGGVGNRAAAERRIEERRSKQLGSGGGGVGVSDDGESKGSKRGGFGKSDLKTRSSNERDGSRDAGNRVVRSFNGDRKRKSMDAGVMVGRQERDSDRNAGKFTRKPIYKANQDKRGDDAHRVRHGREEKVDRFDRSSQDVSLDRRKSHREDEFLDKKIARRDDVHRARHGREERVDRFDRSSQDVSLGRKKNYSQDGFLDKKSARHSVKDEPVIDGGYRNGKGQKDYKSKVEVTKQSEQEERKLSPLTPRRSLKKKIEIKKSYKFNDSEGLDEPEKKKRRRIRIDRYDTSNKRIDDGIDSGDIVPKKEDDSVQKHENDTNLGVNAQFRAIVPSRSILSFVEDNLLGRRREIDFRRAGYNTELPFPLDNIPHSSSSERERIEEPLFRNDMNFFAAAKVSSSIPPPDLPEIAFAGRSNVGKSSLLNALTRRWGVVRTSDKPGLTQTINFFNLGTKLCMVDLPGYGFAYAKDEVKEDWEELVKEYVSTRENLKRVCFLVDAKWGMKPHDRQFIDLMERSQTKYQIVLTKTDTVFPIDVARRAMQIEESLKKNKSVVQPLMMVSSRNGAGIRSLRAAVSKLARYVKP